ncbi:helix-turn-helix transcriptional regulator [Pseudomonas sp. MF6772]|uniref:AraC family transcriptional regulator n=1 Tax=unclassified Pseudomonas TaxID=196821 RepID=UPI0018E89DEF|nr:helix-turn-helix transcriptional regulator [Pseudomonas sp. MF6772]
MYQAKLYAKNVKMPKRLLPPHAPSAKIVTAIGFTALSEGLSGPEPHLHGQGQLVLSMQGVVACEVAESHWIVPPNCALWIPANLPHESRASANARGYFLFIDPSASPLPEECCTFSISSMLREMIIELCEGRGDRSTRSKDLIAQLVVEELSAMPTVHTHFPIPSDFRLQQIAEALIKAPGDRRTLEQWSSFAGMSERTLARQLFKETGMSFGKWRRQLHLMVALKLLAEGKSVQQVAGDLGYEAVTSFITMFKLALGTTPAKYGSLFDVRQRRERLQDSY